MFRIWNRKNRRMLIERIEMYASAGLPIEESISQAGKGLHKKNVASIEKVRYAVENGQLISTSFSSEFGFPAAVIGIISCGESSGSLSQAFKNSHLLLEREDELIKKCLSAMTYPCVIAFAALVLTVGLVRGIMPQITPLLIGLHTDLPVLTKIVMRLSDLMTAYGIIVVGCSILIGAIAIWAYRKIYWLRRVIHSFFTRTPIIGDLVIRYSLAVFFQSMGALSESGMPVNKAYTKAIESISLIPLRSKLAATVAGVNHGGSFAEAFSRNMPSYIAPLISAGEASGNLNSAFIRASTILDRELDHSLKRMTALIEPVMMIFMGCTVGGIALSIMMPIYDISKTLQH